MTGLKEKMRHPFALVAQGFIVGGLLFFSTHSVEAAPLPASAATTLPSLH